MAHVIGAACEKCAKCVEVCPTEAIHPTNSEADFESVKRLYIDPDSCADCGVCVEECPTKAIFPEDDLPADQKEWQQAAVDFYQGRN
ncbi:MAG: putative ferredoxin/ferredoxin--NADP reductase [Phycisphaerae bacterium]|nr:putative ferredoxin/ferredoxin--NADP reductase [Phycisphaerae bacterium]